MSVHRVMGVETEYGIFAPQRPGADSAQLSATVLEAYREANAALDCPEPVRWDYSGTVPGSSTDRRPTWVARLTAQEEVWYRGSSLVTASGARLYVDHGHPEHSSPEVMSPQEAVRYDVAGDLMMQRAMEHLTTSGGEPIVLFKNNVDGKGASYGSHENYLVDRAVPFDMLADALVPFLVTRGICCGSGRVGLGPGSEEPGFQLWQRADYIERRIGLETTVNRPIVNTRDEPHADPARWRRLHVITGDATSAQASTLLKVGTTSLVLSLVESGRMKEDLGLVDPVAAIRTISHDPGLDARVDLLDGRRLTGLEILRRYQFHVLAHLREELGGDPTVLADADTREVLTRWDAVLTALETGSPEAGRWVEWVAKRELLEGFRARDGLAWDDPRLVLVDLQWSHGTPGKGLARRLEARGRLERLT
ncbi:MAG: proteasome accessory factor PafA2 family protein, partial [Micrococcales bacterium]|nr:proteasome accessory factor PafA2 family protein [Micrococcales bacterium]